MTHISSKPVCLLQKWGIRHFSTIYLAKKEKKKLGNIDPNIVEPKEESK